MIDMRISISSIIAALLSMKLTIPLINPMKKLHLVTK